MTQTQTRRPGTMRSKVVWPASTTRHRPHIQLRTSAGVRLLRPLPAPHCRRRRHLNMHPQVERRFGARAPLFLTSPQASAAAAQLLLVHTRRRPLRHLKPHSLRSATLPTRSRQAPKTCCGPRRLSITTTQRGQEEHMRRRCFLLEEGLWAPRATRLRSSISVPRPPPRSSLLLLLLPLPPPPPVRRRTREGKGQ